MTDHATLRIQELEQEVTRLRRLLDERGSPGTLRHQVRNALGVMRSILRRSATSKSSVEDYAAHVEGRFDALLRVQSLLIAASDVGADLHAIIGNELLANLISESDRATLAGPAVVLRPKMAELLRLAVHELATNAVKFGAMTTAEGRIAISWSCSTEPGLLTLEWSESGLTELAAPGRRGFGTDVVESMVRFQADARGSLEFRPQGIRCIIEIPLDNRPA